jgi:hypothetical protein
MSWIRNTAVFNLVDKCENVETYPHNKTPKNSKLRVTAFRKLALQTLELIILKATSRYFPAFKEGGHEWYQSIGH